MKKGQLIPFVFIILTAFLVTVAFILFNLFYGRKYEEKIFGLRTLDVMRNLIEDLRNYLKLSLTYSSHQALREHAEAGGLRGAGAWICNRPNPPPPDLSKRCLENYTKYYLNIYLEKFNTTLPLKIDLKKFEFVNYSVDPNEVLQVPSPFDEGNFSVNSSRINVTVFTKDKQIMEYISITEFITKNRFWYMFRVFTEWAKEDPLSNCICGFVGCACSSLSEKESCSPACHKAAEFCANIALESLKKKFDHYVNCTTELPKVTCCNQGVGGYCQQYECFKCELGWDGCALNCEHKCEEQPSQTSYAQKNKEVDTSIQYSSIQSYQLPLPLPDGSKPPSGLTCKARKWREARLGASFSFSCIDDKYYIPSSAGPQPLKFTVTAFASFIDRDACKSFVDCFCPPNAMSCDKCQPIEPACTPCEPSYAFVC
jgi:hypothetical protein